MIASPTKEVQEMEGINFLLDGSRGIYIPQNFAENFDTEEWHVSQEDANILLAGPDHDLYWETWDDVLSTAFYEQNGHTFTLYQDGDLFALCPSLMTPEEREDWSFVD